LLAPTLAFGADAFEHFGDGSQLRARLDCPKPGVRHGILQVGQAFGERHQTITICDTKPIYS
jgi:hypothetical protein